MANFNARVASNGKVKNINIIADNAEDAQQQAKRSGRVIGIKKQSALKTIFQPGMRTEERIVFIQRLAMMVESRVPMGQALQIMRDAFGGAVRRVANDLYRRVETGGDFGEAITQMKKDFPETTAALINSGVRGSDLSASLKNAAQFEVEMDHIRRNSARGMGSALFTFLTSIGMILGVTFVIGPMVINSDIFTKTPGDIDISWVFTIAYWISGFIGTILVGVLFLLGLKFIVKPIAPTIADRVILKIPIFRDLVLAKNNYTTFHSLGMLVSSGVRMEEALDLSQDAAPRGEVRNDLKRAYQAVRNGRSWPMAMLTLHPTDVAALSTSQDRDQIARSVQAVAEQYRNTYTQRIQEVVPGLQLLSALFMAIAGGLIFGMVILPMLMLTQNLL